MIKSLLRNHAYTLSELIYNHDLPVSETMERFHTLVYKLCEEILEGQPAPNTAAAPVKVLSHFTLTDISKIIAHFRMGLMSDPPVQFAQEFALFFTELVNQIKSHASYDDSANGILFRGTLRLCIDDVSQLVMKKFLPGKYSTYICKKRALIGVLNDQLVYWSEDPE